MSDQPVCIIWHHKEYQKQRKHTPPVLDYWHSKSNWYLKLQEKHLQEDILPSEFHEFQNFLHHTGVNAITYLTSAGSRSKDEEMPKDWMLELFFNIFTSNLVYRGTPQSGSSIQFPEEVKTFVKEAKLPPNTLRKVEDVIRSLNRYIQSQGLKARIEPSMFVDPEEPDWQEIKLTIFVNKDLEYIKNNLQTSILKFAGTVIPSDLRDKILIKIRPLSNGYTL